MSPSHPIANCLISAGVLNEYKVLDVKVGESAPFINITGKYTGKLYTLVHSNNFEHSHTVREALTNDLTRPLEIC